MAGPMTYNTGAVAVILGDNPAVLEEKKLVVAPGKMLYLGTCEVGPQPSHKHHQTAVMNDLSGSGS